MLHILRKIYSLLPSQRRRQLLWLTVGMFTMSFIELGLAGMVSLLGVALGAPDSLEKIGPIWRVFQALPSFGENIPQGIRLLILVLGLVCLATLLKNILAAILTYRQNLVSQLVSWDIGIRIFDNYLYAPYIWHTQRNPGELNNYLGWRIYVSNFFLGGLQTASQVGIMFFLMAGAFVMAPLISLLLYGMTACAALIIYKTTQARARAAGATVAQLSTATARVTHSALHGIREVQIYDQQTAFSSSFISYALPTARAGAQQALYPALPSWCLETTGMLLLWAAVILMALRKDSVANITGTLTLMAAIAWRLLPAVNKIVGGILHLKSNISPVQTLFTNYLIMPRSGAKTDHQAFTRSIALANVSFSYPQSKGEALHDVSLTIPKGSMVGFVGLSGAGKSTLVGVLTGLLSPDSGTLLVDNKVVTPLPGFLRIGYVPQSPYIMDASLAENVAFYDWGRTPDEARVRECCRMAAMDFLDDLPQNVHTVLGDRGVRLSGGQVQRVAIARALYGEPDILLFDEATSALDGAAEAAIQSTILNLREGMTVLIVAHRLSTVQGCDRIYWLDKGTVKMQGSAAAVLEKYQELLHHD